MEDNLRDSNADYVRSDRRLLTGVFNDRETAEHAYNALRDRGYTPEEINLIMSEDTRKKHFTDKKYETEIGSKAMEGLGTGSAIGGTVGAIAGVIAAIGTSLVIPGLGLIIAGPIAAGLAGAGAGGITGGLIGALIGSGIPKEHAAVYEDRIKRGGIVLGVRPRTVEDERYFEDLWRAEHAEEIHTS